MTFISSLLQSRPYLLLPSQLTGWVSLVIFLLILVYFTFRMWQAENRSISRQEKIFILFLALLVPLTSLFLGVRLPTQESVLNSSGNSLGTSTSVMLFSALPWILAGGMVHPVAAVILAVLSGLCTGFWETHTLLTPLEFALLSLIYCVMVRQHYRTWIYRLLRHPFFAAVLSGLLYIPIFLIGTSLANNGDLAAGLDVAIHTFSFTSISILGQMLIAGLVAEIVYAYFPFYWVEPGLLQPSPSEKHLEIRFLFGMGPVLLLLIIGMMVGNWLVAENATNQILRQRLDVSTQSVGKAVPSFLATGQSTLSQVIHSQDLLQLDPDSLQTALSRTVTKTAFFNQVLLFAGDGNLLGAFPEVASKKTSISAEERVAIQQAQKGVENQVIQVAPFGSNPSPFVSFIQSIQNDAGKTTGVLIGRTDFVTTPEAKTIQNALLNTSGKTGASYLIDSYGNILFRAGGGTTASRYAGKIPSKAGLYSEINLDGTQNKVYYLPIGSQNWGLLVSVPAAETQQMTWKFAGPLFLMILLLAVIAYGSIRLGLRSITKNMRVLAEETERIAQGQLDHHLPYQGIDEIGQLNQAYEQMRQTLKGQWDELNTLLAVSQKVSASLSMDDTVKPILEALVSNDASSARIVLTPDALLDPLNEIPSRFGDGYAKDFYSYLDDQILALCRTRDSLNLGNLVRGRVLKLAPDLPHPGSLYAVALRQEARYYGVLWVAFDLPKVFTEAEIRFITNLAGEAALAVTNSRLYGAVELVRQRLDAILSSTPDPILVIDQRGRLLITNPPALNLLNDEELFILGQPIDEVVRQRELLDFLQSDEKTREIVFPNDQVFSATAADMLSDHQKVGKVCILRNITRFKELETLKTEFVETVSHDLRGPLTLMRGYATMVQMVGDLNEQQKSYVKKMISGIEGMSRLVNNLLDLGRIESGEGLQIEEVKTRDLTDKVVNGLQLQATQKNIKVVVDIPEEANPTLEADQALLHQALYNLVDNGIKYTPVGGQVTIRVIDEPTSVTFQVEDTGIGIAPLDQPRLFEKFYRPGPREGYHQRGSSLGLAIVKSIADRHSGKVWVDSQLGKGSRFYLRIPRKEAETSPVHHVQTLDANEATDLDRKEESEYNHPIGGDET